MSRTYSKICLFFILVTQCLKADEGISDSLEQEKLRSESDRLNDSSNLDSLPHTLQSDVTPYGWGGRSLGSYVGISVENLSSGLKFIFRCLSATALAVHNVSRHIISRAAKTVWFQKSSQLVHMIQNKTARQTALSSISALAAAAYTKAPDFFESAVIALDTSAQYTTEV